MLHVLSGALVVGTMLWIGTQSARAIKPFKEEFELKYVKADSKDAKDKEFAEVVAKAKCNVCHLGKKKKDRNPYGTELSKLLDKKADKEDAEKIRKALDTVAKMKSDPKDEKSPTFGELLQAGQLPGGDPGEQGGEEDDEQ
ncbi:MAG: hypothetical protein A2V98_16845 [Planctomycetes bacterium RBG_16_64_12]|nr:MAG: hypothetical protein A2V98_16845 [Planctomycetes bacterium RBG_16_64_12]